MSAPAHPDAAPAKPALTEDTVSDLVEIFYGRAREDALLRPLFVETIHDWDAHLARIKDFWSKQLLGTERYSGHSFMQHAVLPIEPAHFERWLALFDATAAELLPPDAHRQAMAKANHMSASFQAGMFTVPSHRFGVAR